MCRDKLGMSERAACRVTGQARSTQRRTRRAEQPDDPDRWLRDWLNTWATTEGNARKGYRRAWADLRAEGHEINKKKVHRLWRQEGLQVAVRRRRKRVGSSTGPIIDADAPNVVWAIDFQFDSTHDGQRFKIASAVDEHTRESLLDIVARSITGEDLVAALTRLIAVRGRPVAIRADNGPELACDALREFCEDQIHIRYIPPGEPWRNGFIESFNNRLRQECLNMNQWLTLLHAKVAISDWKHAYNTGHRHSSLAYQTPAEYASACSHSHRLQ
jgi:transposase InsO family protein